MVTPKKLRDWADHVGDSRHIGGRGLDRQETGEQKAQRIVLEEMKRLRWVATDLHQRRKGDVDKETTARRLRQATPVSLKWIAQRLPMGSGTYVFNL